MPRKGRTDLSSIRQMACPDSRGIFRCSVAMNRSGRPASASAASAAIPPPKRWPLAALFALILGVTLIAYLPALSGGRLWDDAGHITRPELQSWAGLLRIWFEIGATQQYYPLLHTAFWVEHRIWSDATIGYHLINVLWHATSACLLAAILRRLRVPGAALAALIFALHPVEVESVAWIAEQKNTLSTVFYLASALAWLRFEEDRRPLRYTISLLWFLAALLTKSVTATLPGALLVIAWWRRGRLSWRGDVLPLLPWLAFGLGAGVGTSWLEVHQIGASGNDFALSGAGRCLLAGRAVWFYLSKLVWPSGLTFFYPRWAIDVRTAWQWLFPIAAVAVLAAGVGWSRRDRGPLAAVLLFGGGLLPALGFVNVYPFVFSFVADHFQYLASLGMIAFFAGAAAGGFRMLGWPGWIGPAAAAGILIALGTLTWRQSAMYHDEFSLYETTLARNPSSWTAHLNLGTLLDDAGRPDESLPHLQRALELKPDFPDTLNSIGNVLNHLGRAAEAQPLLERAIRIEPRFGLAHNTLGDTLMALGRPDEGIAQFRKALEFDPALVLARVNLGWALAHSGHESEALEQLDLARRQRPDLADTELKIGLTLATYGRLPEALPHFSRAVELQPNQADLRYVLGRALLELGRRQQGIEQLEATLALAPHHVGATQELEKLRQETH